VPATEIIGRFDELSPLEVQCFLSEGFYVTYETGGRVVFIFCPGMPEAQVFRHVKSLDSGKFAVRKRAAA